MRQHLYLQDDYLKECVELIFYAYNEIYSDPKSVLKKYSFGVAHHRALYLIERNKGVSFSELLIKLKIKKQSLNRVLKDLINKKIIYQKNDELDSRRKKIYLDELGKKFYDEIFNFQRKRIYNALKSSDSDSVKNFKDILKKIISE